MRTGSNKLNPVNLDNTAVHLRTTQKPTDQTQYGHSDFLTLLCPSYVFGKTDLFLCLFFPHHADSGTEAHATQTNLLLSFSNTLTIDVSNTVKGSFMLPKVKK